MYIALDGDQIGRRLELLLFADDDERVAAFSTAISTAVRALATQLEDMGLEIVFSGGDSVLAKGNAEIDLALIQLQHDEISFSLGIGETPSKALLSLKSAKLGDGPNAQRPGACAS